MRRFGKHRLTAFRLIAFGFIALFLMGALLLFLPLANRKTGSAGFMDGLYPTVSALCVTDW